LTYTAKFRQPTGALNPLGVKFRDAWEIEIFPTGRKPVKWRARSLWPNGSTSEIAGVVGIDANDAQAQTARVFEKQETRWYEHRAAEDDVPPLSRQKISRPNDRDRYGIRSM
jgi:hypothetical protein